MPGIEPASFVLDACDLRREPRQQLAYRDMLRVRLYYAIVSLLSIVGTKTSPKILGGGQGVQVTKFHMFL